MPDSHTDVYESYAERQIRRAQADGAFDALPGAGRPLPDLDRPYDPAWWARKWAERQRHLDRAHAVARAAERALGEVWLLPDETAVVRRVAELNETLAEAAAGLPPTDRPVPIDVEQALRAWRSMEAGRRRRNR